MRPLIVIFSIISLSARAAHSDWLCTEEASQRDGNVISACGIGTGADENAARLKAFDAANAEFTKVCNNSDDCRGHKVSVEPKRTACESEKGKVTCYRLLAFTIGDAAKKGNEGAAVSMKENPESFPSFVAADAAKYPKVRAGMSKEELYKNFGLPDSVTTLGLPRYDRKMLMYRGKMCQGSSCDVVLVKGAVDSWSDFKPIYTGDVQ